MEKLHFQSRPHLYVTGNLYLPKDAKPGAKLPAVLYVCGHSGRGRDGNKTAFQHHGMWFATHGYVCLIIDSLQLGEIAGIHHGTYRYNRWWWQARGYAPSAVECWNGMRALDYLQSRPEVDPDRLAVTGISGGGAASFWIAAADERVKVAVARQRHGRSRRLRRRENRQRPLRLHVSHQHVSMAVDLHRGPRSRRAHCCSRTPAMTRSSR